MSKNTGGSAFPMPNGTETTIGTEGMTLRDYFAGQALAGICASDPEAQGYSAEYAAERAYRFADAMIEAREAEGGKA